MVANPSKQPTTAVRLLKIPQVAESTEMSRRKIDELVASGELPCIRIGRSVRVDVRDLEDFLALHKSN